MSEHQGPNPPPLTEGHPIADEAALDPLLELMGEGMSPMPEGTDMDRFIAAVDVIARTGATDFECGYDDDYEPDSWWYARCTVRDGSPEGLVQTIGSRPDPVDAAERLARRLINGGTCTHCGRTMSLSRKGYGLHPMKGQCLWSREGKRWERGCRDLVAEGVRQEAVIDAFLKTGQRQPIPTVGHYHDSADHPEIPLFAPEKEN